MTEKPSRSLEANPNSRMVERIEILNWSSKLILGFSNLRSDPKLSNGEILTSK